MNFANKKSIYYLFILIVLMYTCNLFPQKQLENPFQTQFNYAKELYGKGEYFDAITELKRLRFFDKENTYKYQANELIGLSYKMGGKFSEAIQYLAFAGINSSNDEELFNSKIEIIRINILRRTIDRALTLLDSLDSDKRFISKKNEINYWRGWSYIFADDWDKAAQEFNKISPDNNLKKLSKEIENERYSITKAKILSFILPGAGQFYTGNYFSGILSFGWNLLWGYITINAINEKRIFDAAAVGDLLWLRFYRGNIQNSGKFAEEKNMIISNKTLNFLQYEYEGEKP